MEQDRQKWNRKYSDNPVLKPPTTLLTDHHHLAEGTRALDLACGLGRHSLYLADHGFDVDAVDISEVAQAGLTHPRIHPIVADLDNYVIKPNHYHLILNTYFLDRRLVKPIIEGLRPGGLLIFETYLAQSTHIENPRFKLKPGELTILFEELCLIHNQETNELAQLVAKKQS